MPSIRSLVLVLGMFSAFTTIALAQNWPTRPVKIVVPSSPGGGTDTFARLISTSLADALKQPFVIDNRPGAGGNIGAEVVAKAAPDGYTLLVSSIQALVVNPYLYKNLPYNSESDFVPVAPGVISPLVIGVHPSVPAKTLADLVALGKRDPGTVAYGSPGSGSSSYLGVRMLEEASGAHFLHVPYKGSGPAYQGLLSGDLKFMMDVLGSFLPYIRSGKVRALAVSVGTDLLPDTPTLAAAGYKDIELYASFMVVAPAGTPPAIVQRANAEINNAMKSAVIAERLHALALIPVFETPEQFAASLKKARGTWSAFIRRNNIVAQQ
jgi:tripartite-type tricarboxylate transporter receptor subunit TctC